MKKILIPVDFEEELATVYEFVERLSENQELAVTLLHVLEYPTAPGNFIQPADYLAEFYTRFQHSQAEKLSKVAELKYFKRCTVTQDLAIGPGTSVSHVISEKAKEGNFDLVLLISRHRSGLNALFVGSELIRTVRQTSVPMLVLSPAKMPSMGRVAFATDFSELSAQTFIKLRKTTELLGLRVHCFYVNTMQEFKDQRQFVEARNLFLNRIGLADLPEIQLYNAWELEAGILQYADDIAADFIALGTHGRRGISALFVNSLTESLLNDTGYPLIVLNMRAMEKARKAVKETGK